MYKEIGDTFLSKFGDFSDGITFKETIPFGQKIRNTIRNMTNNPVDAEEDPAPLSHVPFLNLDVIFDH